MATLSFAQLESVWIQAGGSSAMAPLMAAIALAESSGNPNATNPTDNGGRQTSWGLWQISNGDHSQPAPNWNDPVENARLALGKLQSQGLGAWGTYDSGAYRQFLQGNVPPDPSGIPAGGGGTGGSTGGGPGGGGTVLPADLLDNPLGTLIQGLAGQGGTVGGLAGFLGGIGAFIGNLDSGLATFFKGVLWLVNPMNWLRIIAGIVGTVALIIGLVFVAKAA